MFKQQALILAIDIGNSFAHLAVYNGSKIIYIRKFPHRGASPEKYLTAPAKKYGDKIKYAGLASVVTEASGKWNKLVKDVFQINPVFISNKILLPVRLKVKNSNTLGADRICNASAGYEYFRRRENVIAVDFGTAITYDVVLKNGDFIGGIIAPGIETMAKSLHSYTSKLPLLKKTDMVMPKKTIGKNTVEALRAGTLISALVSFEGMISRIEKEQKKKFKIILTGGPARQIHAGTKLKTVLKENLVLDGINCILKYNYGNIHKK